MVELQASITSSQTSITQINAAYERSNTQIQKSGGSRPPPPPPPSELSNPQQQIIDEVNISEQAVQKFEDAQILAEQLRAASNYLSAGGDPASLLSSLENQQSDNTDSNDSNVTIAAEQTSLAASITVIETTQETLDINATFDDAGNLTALSIDKTSITAQYTKADLILEERQFFAQA